MDELTISKSTKNEIEFAVAVSACTIATVYFGMDISFGLKDNSKWNFDVFT